MVQWVNIGCHYWLSTRLHDLQCYGNGNNSLTQFCFFLQVCKHFFTHFSACASAKSVIRFISFSACFSSLCRLQPTLRPNSRLLSSLIRWGRNENSCLFFLFFFRGKKKKNSCITWPTELNINLTIWSSDAKWQHKYWSTLDQIMASCLIAQCHYLFHS